MSDLHEIVQNSTVTSSAATELASELLLAVSRIRNRGYDPLPEDQVLFAALAEVSAKMTSAVYSVWFELLGEQVMQLATSEERRELFAYYMRTRMVSSLQVWRLDWEAQDSVKQSARIIGGVTPTLEEGETDA